MINNILITKSILIILAEKSFNEIEFSHCKEIFEKNGYKIVIASESGGFCLGDSGARIKADIPFFNIHSSNYISIVVIGGTGATKYFDSTKLHSVIQDMDKDKKIIAAICIAPVVLAKAGILKGRNAVCNSNGINQLKRARAVISENSLMVDEHIITAIGPDEAIQFAELVINSIKSKMQKEIY